MFLFIFLALSFISIAVYSSSIPDTSYLSYVLCKMFCSTIFVVTGICSMFFSKTRLLPYPILILCGLIFGLLGDLFLALSGHYHGNYFILGLIAFFINHILFIAAFSFIKPFKSTELIICFILYLITLITINYFHANLGNLKIPVYLYGAALFLMMSKAITLVINEGSFVNIIILIGAVLFVASDLYLCIDMFILPLNQYVLFNTITYFIGQTLIASSIYYYLKNI